MVPPEIRGMIMEALVAQEQGRDLRPDLSAIMGALSSGGISPQGFLASPQQDRLWEQLAPHRQPGVGFRQGAGFSPAQGFGPAKPAGPPAPPPLTGLAPGTGQLLNPHLQSSLEVMNLIGGLGGGMNFGFGK